jgi:glutamate carboxypeptidase
MAPQNGRNAAVELVHQLSALEGAFPHSGDGTTVNLTILKAGERNNIIPDLAQATLNVRYRKQEDFDTVLSKVEAGASTTLVPDTHVTVMHDPAFPPLTENPKIDALAARARAIYAEIGQRRRIGIRPGDGRGHRGARRPWIRGWRLSHGPRVDRFDQRGAPAISLYAAFDGGGSEGAVTRRSVLPAI